MAAAAARAGRRWSPPGAASTSVCTARMVERSACGTHTGEANWSALRPVEEHHQPAGDGLGHIDAEVLLDQRQREVDAGGHPRTRPVLAVADVDRIGVDGDPGYSAASWRARAQCVVTRRPSNSPAAAPRNAPEQTVATRRSVGRSGGRNRPRLRRVRPPRRRGRPERTRVSIRSEQRAGVRCPGRARSRRGRWRHPERQGSPGRRPLARAPRPPGRPGEDLVRADGVERLKAVKGDDHDVAFLHGSQSAGRRGWRQ